MISLMMFACLVQAPQTLDVTTVGKDARWQVAGRTTAVVDTNGKHALRMIEVAPLMGLVWLKDYDFGDGTIEVDLLGRTQPVQGSFLGVAFQSPMRRPTRRCTSGRSIFGRLTQRAT